MGVSFSESWSAVAAALFPTFYSLSTVLRTQSYITSAGGHTQAPVLWPGPIKGNIIGVR